MKDERFPCTFKYIVGIKGRFQVIKVTKAEISRSKLKFEHKFLCHGKMVDAGPDGKAMVFPFKKLLVEITGNSPLDEFRKLGAIFCGACAMEHLHKSNYDYRVFKSEFIYVEDDYTGRIPCVPSIASDDRGSKTPKVNEQDYVAPEQVDHDKCYNKQVDVWALGVGLAHAFGLVIREGQNAYWQMCSSKKLNFDEPEEPWRKKLVGLAKACLQLEPHERPSMNFAACILLSIMKMFVDGCSGTEEHAQLVSYFNTLKEYITVPVQSQ